MLQRMNDCIQYVEDHLDQKIELEELARLTFSSKFHFQRLFHMLVGTTVAEYIRKRRLTLAAQELMQTNAKVIDVAFKYGYETPESFSKAFRKEQGILPSQAKEPGNILKAFPRISFQLSIKGEKAMDYKIVEREAFKVIGKGRSVSTVDDQHQKEITMFWNEFNSNGTSQEICKAANNDDMMGICMEFDHGNEAFTYFIGAESEITSHDWEVKEISAQTWAVFESIGPMPNAIQAVWKRIYSEWFPSTGYEHAEGPELELYPPENVNDANYRCEIWIPIKKK